MILVRVLQGGTTGSSTVVDVQPTYWVQVVLQ